MAASQVRPRAATASICSLEKESGEHTFEIRDYSYQTDLDTGYIFSDRFTIGGHDFRIRYYPEGIGNGNGDEDSKDYVGVQLELMSEFTKVRLAYEFRLVDDDDHAAAAIKSTTTLLTAENPACGTDKFKKKSDLPRFLRNDDSLKIHCVVTVIKESQLKETAVISSNSIVVVQVPPSNLSSHLAELLSQGRNDVDVTFKVKSEVFRAHKLILDIRCPALLLRTHHHQPQQDAQPMTTTRDRRASNNPDHNHNSSSAAAAAVVIEDMEPRDFKALLHFIYTDSLPKEHRNSEEMAASLLAAADKYDMKRMKLYCGNILSKRPTVDSVTTTIALAHSHHCRELKDACIQFINSSERTRDDVLSSDGYKELKDTCPVVALEILENTDRKKVFKKAVERQQADPGEERSAQSHRGEVSGESDSKGESRSVLPVQQHWLTSCLSFICEAGSGCLPCTEVLPP